MFSHLTALRETRRAIEHTISKWEKMYGPGYLSVMGECITDGLAVSHARLSSNRQESFHAWVGRKLSSSDRSLKQMSTQQREG